jgi:hypothetical protein
MARLRTGLSYAAGLALIVAICPPLAGAAQATPVISSAGALAVPRSPHPGHASYLSAVRALSSTDAWSVGYYCTSNCGKATEVDRSLILHWNGTAWSTVTSPVVGTQDALTSVTALSASNIWAAGTSFSSTAGFNPLILHWNGTAWSNQSPKVPNVAQILGISAESGSDIWVVGNRVIFSGGGAVLKTLILHWNDKSWSQDTSPSPSPARNILYNVSASSPTDAWAVGGYCTSNCSGGPTPPVDHTLILHWNGTAWSRVTSPSVTGADLHSVAELSTNNAWATGFGTSSNLMLRWNGTAWSKVSFPNSSPAFSVAFSSATDGWVVGFGGFTHWNGTQWSPLTVSTPPDSNLQAVSADSANDAWAVGFYCVSNCGTTSPVWNTEILHWNGTNWIGQ